METSKTSLSVKILIAVAAAAGVLWLVASVKSALTPFVLAVVFCYITAPLADKMEQRGAPPAAAAGVIILLLFALLAAVPFALLPLMAAQLQDIAALLPKLVAKIETKFGGEIIAAAKQQLQQAAGDAGLAGAKQAINAAAKIFGGGLAFIGGAASVLLITPLAVFYFLRDRARIGGELIEMLPPNLRPRAAAAAKDFDNVLGEFLHGQLLVMLTMAFFYSAVLWVAGLKFAVTIGVVSGLLTFIPYVGFILGLALATLVALGDFQSWLHIAAVWALMGIGTTLESVVITPRLVGERVGLHPLAVLLSLLVMGELFGFLGLLASLPTAAVLLVCARYARRFYINSDFYRQW